ncbi:hypothetical protein K7432_017801 [Basidiobolus ranarum]|uniref:MICOS complex subunit n=1 Tax=Basidiobolus ranarum TaxID=34480 RepID=A0ABR2WCX2_9FUNG
MVSQSRPEERKLNIYDEPVVPVVVIEEPTRLETLGKQLRGALRCNINYAQKQVQGLVNEWIRVEQRVENTVKQVVPKTEKVFPGAFYILVSGMAGSIFARNKNILFRLTAPLTFATASSFYFLPQTSRSVTFHLLRKFEDNKTAQKEVAQVKSRLSNVAADISNKATEVTEKVNSAVETKKIQAKTLVEEAKDIKANVENTVSEVVHEKKQQVEDAVEKSKESIQSQVDSAVTTQEQVTEDIARKTEQNVNEAIHVVQDKVEQARKITEPTVNSVKQTVNQKVDEAVKESTRDQSKDTN